MPSFDRVSPSDSISELKPIPDTDVLQEKKRRFCSIINQAVQLFLLLNKPNSFRRQLVQNLPASMNDNLVDDQLLIGRIEVEGNPRIRLDPRRRNKLLSHMNES